MFECVNINIMITNYKNKDERYKQILNYREALQQQIDVNQRISDAMGISNRNSQLNIAPPPAQYKNATEEVADAILQREKCMANLKLFMNSNDSSTALAHLQSANEVVLFNRFSTNFIQDIKNQTNITPLIFVAIWEQFKEKLLQTTKSGLPTGIMIPAVIKPLMFDRAHELSIMSEAQLDVVFDKCLIKYLGREPVDGEFIKIPSVSGDKHIKKLTLKNHSYIWDIIPNDKIKLIIYVEYHEPLRNKIQWVGPQKISYPRMDNFGEITEIEDGPIKQGREFVKQEQQRLIKQEQKQEQSSFIEKELLPKQNRKGPPFKGKKKGKGIRLMYGSGFEAETLSIANSAVVGAIGALTKKNQKENKLKSFGNYLINNDVLQKGFLSILYTSGHPIQGFPKVMISSNLKMIINDILFTKKFSEEDYTILDDSEKRLFDDLLSFCKLEMIDTIKLYKHKKYTDKSRDEDIKQFNILKGEIIAGNDNPDVIKQMKVLVMKLLDQKVITKKDYTKIITTMMIIA